MAVEIPVVIDIEGAFDEAAKKVDTAIRPLKRKIDDETASLKLTVGVDEFGVALKKTVKQITDITKLLNGKVKLGASIGEVSKALDDARSRYANLEALRSKGASIDLNRLKSLREAIIILTQELEQRTRIVELVSEEANRQIRVNRAIEGGEYAMIREAKTIAEINEKISALRGKLENIDPKSKEWTNTAKEIRSATNELAKFEEKFKNILGSSSTSKAGSINRMSEDMRKLEDRWNSMSATMKFDKDGRLKASAQKIVDKYKELSSQAEKTGKSLRDMTRPPREELEKFNATATKTSATMRQLTSYATSFVSVWSVASFMKRIRETTAEFELQEVALGGILQNTVKAHSLFEQIKAAAVKSPFFVKDLVTYTKQLSAYRIETDKLFDVTMQLADVSAGLGVDMNRLILAYGQVRAASVLRGQELRQFTEAGVPLVELLAEKFSELRKETVSTADVFKLISERAVPFSMIADIFDEMTSAGGIFYKMQEKQAETLSGRWNNLKDSIAITMDEIGRTPEIREFFDLSIAAAKTLMSVIGTLVKNIKLLGIAFLAAKTYSVLFGASARKAAIANQKLAWATRKSSTGLLLFQRRINIGTASITRMQLATANLTLAVKKLWAAFLANPLGVVAGAIGAVLSIFDVFGKKADSAGSGDIGADIESFKKREHDMLSLVNGYDELTKKEELNEREKKRLAAITRELTKEFNGYGVQIDEETKKIGINTDAIRQRAGEDRRQFEIRMKAAEKEHAAALKSNEDRQKYLTLMLEAQEIMKNDKDFYEDSGWGATRRADLLSTLRDRYGLTIKEFNAVSEWLDGSEDYVHELERVAEWISGEETILEQIREALYGKKENIIEFTGWQAYIKDLQSKLNIIQYLDNELQNFTQLVPFLEDVAKKYKEYKTMSDQLRKSIAATTGEEKEKLEQDLKSIEKKVGLYFDILQHYDAMDLLNKNGRTKSRVSELREELKTVQDIYKKFEDLQKFMTTEDAAKEIRKIYAGVTDLDFLNPEDYKKRLRKIVDEMRDALGQARKMTFKFNEEAANDMASFIKGHEGFRSKAYKNAGERAYTVGYGFYDVLPDGRKVTKDMEITREEAEELFKLALPRYIGITEKALAEFGKGMELTDKQFTALVDLAYQGPSVVRRVIKAADGDINKLAQSLKTAAQNAVPSEQREGVAKRDMDRYVAFVHDLMEEGDAEAENTIVEGAEKIVQDVDWDLLKKDIEKELENLSNEIKRSEAARDFYKNILSTTGDEDLAASVTVSIYGDIGKDFADRMKQELSTALTRFDFGDDAELKKTMEDAVEALDFETILKNIDKFAPQYQKRIRQLAENNEKYYGDQWKELLKSLEGVKTYGERRLKIESEAQERRDKILSRKGLSQKQRDMLLRQSAKKEAEAVAKLQYEAFKDSPMYIRMFSNLDSVSVKILKRMKANLKDMAEQWKDLDPTQLKEMQSRLEEVNKKIAEKNPFVTLRDAFKEFLDLRAEGRTRQLDEESAIRLRKQFEEEKRKLEELIAKAKRVAADSNATEEDKKDAQDAVDRQVEVVDKTKEATEAAEKDAGAWDDITQGISDAAAGLSEFASVMGSIVDSTQKIVDTFASAEDSEMFGNYATGIKETISGISNMANGAARMMSGDYLGGAIGLFSGIADVVSGIWGTSSRERIRKADKDIKEQQRLIDNLKESYDRLGDAMAKSFGSDYIYNFQTQLKLLEAQAAAYRKQADAERGKGKKADADAVREYEKSAREVEQQIKDMRDGLSSFFTGTDVTSAAKDFASAWLDAYRSFSSTTGAMKEKFQDLVQEMVINSLAAQMVQSILGPWFEQIDNMAKSGGILDANEISQIAAETGGYVDVINAALTNLMNELAGAGLNMREKVGSLTGIKREIGGATEETMSAVAVGLNTQNFYLSFVPGIGADVAAIREALTGESSVTRSSVNISSSGFGDDVFRGQMSRIDENIMEIRTLLKSVISPRGITASTHSVSVKY